MITENSNIISYSPTSSMAGVVISVVLPMSCDAFMTVSEVGIGGDVLGANTPQVIPQPSYPDIDQ